MVRKVAFTLLISIACSCCFAQGNDYKATRFKLVYYQANGVLKEIRDEVIKDNFDRLDLYFISNHFYSIPLPKAFTDKKYKNEKIEFSSGDTPEVRRTNYVEYDNSSKVVTYGRTGCMICADLGYVYDVKYNISGQIIQLMPSSKWILMPSSEEYKIHYETSGDVKSVDMILNGKITFQVILQ